MAERSLLTVAERALDDAAPGPFTVCVFCGARSGNGDQWISLAQAVGAAIAERGWRLVYGGGRVGLMGALADGAIAAGGQVLGIIPQSLLAREQAVENGMELEIVSDMATRKTRMIALSDAFLTLPGGWGTLDELFEVLTLRQIGLHDKPVAVLDHQGYWQSMLAMCDTMVDAGLLTQRNRDMILVANEVSTLLDQVAPAR